MKIYFPALVTQNTKIPTANYHCRFGNLQKNAADLAVLVPEDEPVYFRTGKQQHVKNFSVTRQSNRVSLVLPDVLADPNPRHSSNIISILVKPSANPSKPHVIFENRTLTNGQHWQAISDCVYRAQEAAQRFQKRIANISTLFQTLPEGKMLEFTTSGNNGKNTELYRYLKDNDGIKIILPYTLRTGKGDQGGHREILIIPPYKIPVRTQFNDPLIGEIVRKVAEANMTRLGQQ